MAANTVEWAINRAVSEGTAKCATTSSPTPEPTPAPTHICPPKQEKACCCPSCDIHDVTVDMVVTCERHGCQFDGLADEACSIRDHAFKRCTAECATTASPTREPTEDPTENPTPQPTSDPPRAPTNDPTENPTQQPTPAPTHICPMRQEKAC